MTEHQLHLTLAARGTRNPHGGRCDCGWTVERLTTAGMVGSAYDAHVLSSPESASTNVSRIDAHAES